MNDDSINHDLKNIVDKEGIDFLSRSPMEVYEQLLSSDNNNKKCCICVLSALLAGIIGMVKDSSSDSAALSKWIQSECCYR